MVSPSALPLVLPAVTFQSLLALANASSALLGLGDSPTDAHYRAALVATMDSILKVYLDHVLFLQLIIIVFGICTSYRLAALSTSKIPTEYVLRIACWCLHPKLSRWSAECRQPSPCPTSQRSEIHQGSSNLLLSRVSWHFRSTMVHSYRYGMFIAVSMGIEM